MSSDMSGEKNSERLLSALQERNKILSIYLTAGYPRINDTLPLIETVEASGAGLVEIGFPFSDPLADGPTIQRSNDVALKNGMNLEELFRQLKPLRQRVRIPVLLMGYLNPVMRYGVDRFCASCQECGIDGVILPDLPADDFEDQYRDLFESHRLHNIFLVTPQTSDKRIREIDERSTAFIYAVSSAAVTGGALEMDRARLDYFRRLESLKLRHPVLVGFGITDRAGFEAAARHTRGAIIGSAFIKALSGADDPLKAAKSFVNSITA